MAPLEMAGFRATSAEHPQRSMHLQESGYLRASCLGLAPALASAVVNPMFLNTDVTNLSAADRISIP